jgi:hypothetical protein
LNWHGLDQWQQWALGIGASLVAALICWLCTRLFGSHKGTARKVTTQNASPVMTQTFQPTINIQLPLMETSQKASQRQPEEKGIQTRKLKESLGRATALEKLVLEAVIHLGQCEVPLDVGSGIAMHLQEIELIEQMSGVSYTVYNLVDGLKELCIKEPACLHVSKEEERTAIAELEEWQRNGYHSAFFLQIKHGTSSRPWA